MVAHEKRNSGQLFCTVPTRNDLALSSLLFTAQPTKKMGYPRPPVPGKRGPAVCFVVKGERITMITAFGLRAYHTVPVGKSQAVRPTVYRTFTGNRQSAY